MRVPGEWETHEACWTAYPWDPEAWGAHLAMAQAEFLDFAQLLATDAGELVNILVPDDAAAEKLDQTLGRGQYQLHIMPYGDSWLRDTAPVFARTEEGDLRANCFQFNGWGNKYVMDGDDQVAHAIATQLNIPKQPWKLVLEGGSIDQDGQGTALTTTQCLLHRNRNPQLDRSVIEEQVQNAYGLTQLVWLDDGLLNDHTDGHVDNIARFVAPGRVVCMEARSHNDPNHAVLNRVAKTLANSVDAQGRKLEVIRLPSVGTILDDQAEPMAASYVNFYIANRLVVVPTYGSPFDQEAIACIAELFPDRKVVGLPGNAILTGGGSFHCITQQQPKART